MPLKLGLGLSPVLAADRLPWTPGEMSNLRAWYDAELGQPKYGGAGAYVQLDGTSGDYIFTPDSAATSFSNDIEVVMRVKVTDWTAAAAQTLVGKYVSTGNQRSWRFYVSAAGAIGLSVSTDGTSGAVTTVSVTPTNALPDNTWIWLRMRLDLTNGSNSVGTLDTATDTGNNTEPSSWTANGTNTGTTISGIFDSTAPTEIGTFAAGTLERLSGQVGRCIVRNGFDGTTVSDFNASDCYGDGYWHSGGYRWNLGLPKVYDRSGNNVAPATFGSGSNQPKWLPWTGRAQVYLPGTAGNYVSSPDSAQLDVGSDLEIVVAAAAASWAPGGAQFICGKWGAGGEWAIVIGPSTIEFWGDGNGSLFFLVGSSSGLLHSEYWFRATRNAATGDVALEYAEAQADEPSSWSTIVSGSSLAGPTTAGSNAVAIGSDSFGTNPFAGIVRRFIMRDGGATVADFNAELCGQSGYTDSPGNVWTVNRSTSGRKTVVQSAAAIDAASSAQLGTDDSIIGPAAAVPSAPSEWSIVWVGRRHESADDWAMLVSTGSNAASTTEGAAIFDYGAGTDQLSAMAHDGSMVAAFDSSPQDIDRSKQTVATLAGTISDLTFAVNGNTPATTSAPGGVVNMSALLIGRATDGGYSDQQWRAAVVVDRALTATEHGLLVAYYGGGL